MMRTQIRSGFTLIELMIVVAIIGILASIAIPAFIKYVKQTKTAEGATNLKAIADGAATYYEVDHYTTVGFPVSEKMFPTTAGTLGDNTAAKVPANIMKGTKFPTSPAVWSVQPWLALKFNIIKPHYYRYRYHGENASNAPDKFSARAEADLDADDITARFNINGSSDVNSEILLTPVFSTDPGNDLE